MPVLCFVILKAEPVYFLSRLQMISVFEPESHSSKAFLDTLVAVKYLFNLGVGDDRFAEEELPSVVGDSVPEL